MAENGDIRAHENTYHGFLALLKWGTLGVAIITAFVVFLIAK